ncbi:hypothetical protein [Streptomyces sp. CC219B]|uniref:hypothetical protein n=1 Tax=Streptomyces sp. CC219B TaxID=3044574 RepID=UPI0024A87911|nr:hypothetical protein [Streptomyces sp. CC219B]
MRTLTLRGGARVAVVAAQWYDAFGVVTGGRVQLELRDGEPGPVLGRNAGFWLRGTGVRALRNPGRRTARVRVVTRRGQDRRRPAGTPRTGTAERRENGMNDMNGTDDTGVAAGRVPARTSHAHRLRGLVGGFVAALAATAATALAAALARAMGATVMIPARARSLRAGAG